jgi:small multidrug resistance family-3 protein
MSALILIVAAVLEVAGDAVIRKGLRAGGVVLVVAGFLVLGSYGVVVNMVKVDFSRLLGAYVGVFAAVSVLAGWVIFGDRVAGTTWAGLGIILVGSAVIHYGR